MLKPPIFGASPKTADSGKGATWEWDRGPKNDSRRAPVLGAAEKLWRARGYFADIALSTWRSAKVATPETTSAVVEALVEDRVFFQTPSDVDVSLELQDPLTTREIPIRKRGVLRPRGRPGNFYLIYVTHAAWDTAEHAVVVWSYSYPELPEATGTLSSHLTSLGTQDLGFRLDDSGSRVE